jgi:hypothetical protein
MPQLRSEEGEPSAPATPGLLLLSYTTPWDAALPSPCLLQSSQHSLRVLRRVGYSEFESAAQRLSPTIEFDLSIR